MFGATGIPSLRQAQRQVEGCCYNFKPALHQLSSCADFGAQKKSRYP
jgi:hypothetical protein